MQKGLVALVTAALAGATPIHAQSCQPHRPTYEAAQQAAAKHIEVSNCERKLYVIEGGDTLLATPVAVASDKTVRHEGQTYTFRTPRGVHRVARKRTDPIWVPPDWHYVEAAHQQGMELKWLSDTKPTAISDGSELSVREYNGERHVGRSRNGNWYPIPLEQHVAYDNTIFVPPIGTKNRQIEGQLGHYSLDLTGQGTGYMIHGTPFKHSIGMATTHGCFRVDEGPLERLYNEIPVGTRVYVY